MISLDSNSTNPPPTNQTNNIIIFECSDVRRDIGIIFLKQKKDENKFEIHLHNDYTNHAIAMILDFKDFARMFESLDEYFINAQIELYE